MSAWASGKKRIFEISRKSNPLLFTLTSSVAVFQMWTDRMTDHSCRSMQRWKHVLDFIAKSTVPVRKNWLVATNLDGINAWDIATMLESLMVDCFPKNVYRRRLPLCGGDLGNVFELWRLLHQECKGGNDAVELRSQAPQGVPTMQWRQGAQRAYR